MATIALLGCGKIGESLLSGLLSSGWRQPDEVVVTGRREERLAELAERYGVQTTLSNAEAVRGADLVVDRRQAAGPRGLLGEIGGIVDEAQTVLSIAAAIPTAAIERRLAAPVPVVRAMPNAPATVHEGIAGHLRRVTRGRRAPRARRGRAHAPRRGRSRARALHGCRHRRLRLRDRRTSRCSRRR